MSFPQFVEAVASIPDDEANPHFRSQAAALLAPDGSLMPDFIGRFERLEQDFREVARRLNVEHTKLPHLTSSGADGYAAYYDGRLARLVEKRCEADVERFGYRF